MTTERHIKRVITAIETSDGAGVKLKRSLGRNSASRVDPLLMLDCFSSDNPNDYIAGFPPHPHRGFETVTYILDGHMLHKDHLGNEGDLRTGGVQWMTAGRGIIHEERPQQTDGLLRGFQLWLNLPAKDKMQPASYQNIEPEEVAVAEYQGVRVKVIAGQLALFDQILQGPIVTADSQALYYDVELAAGSHVYLPIEKGLNGIVYVFEGDIVLDDTIAQLHNAYELTDGDGVSLTSEHGGRLLLIAAKPFNEPIAQYGPFVMNTMEEIEQAIQDYRDGTLTA